MDSGYSRNVKGDRRNFITWKPIEKVNAIFVKNNLGKINEKGVVNLSNGKHKFKNLLYVDGLKNNLLSESQMCDQGYGMVFNAKNC